MIIDNVSTRKLLELELEPGDLLFEGKEMRLILSVEKLKGRDSVLIDYFYSQDNRFHKDELALQCMLYYGCFIVRNV